jgi:hypothetical protein
MCTELVNIMDAPPGAVVETYHWGTPSGSYYKLGGELSPIYPRRVAYRNFRGGRTTLHGSLQVRVVDPATEGVELVF